MTERAEVANDVRRMTDADVPDVLALLRSVMGWGSEDRVGEFFEWKHWRNPFGVSPGWVGLDPDGAIAAARILMRWRFVAPDGRPVDAVRAVDTATRGDQQGKGWFTRLTMGAVGELTDEGVGFVFNTPNSQSWPGYSKMGWEEAARPPVRVRPKSPLRLPKLLGARASAEKWSSPVGNAPRAGDWLADHRDQLSSLVAATTSEGLRTERSPEYLCWRYGLESLGYQAMATSPGAAGGVVIYRVRRRGRAREATVCELLLPEGAPARTGRQLVGAALEDSGADYALVAGAVRRSGTLPIPNLGPLLAIRPLAAPSAELALSLGDIELF